MPDNNHLAAVGNSFAPSAGVVDCAAKGDGETIKPSLPWGYACHEIVDNRDNVIAKDVSVIDCKRITDCVNALAGIADPEAWVNAAKEVQRLAVCEGFPIELANALLDMKAAEGGE